MYLRRVRRDRLVFDDETIEGLAAAFGNVSVDESQQLDFLQDCLRGLAGRSKELCDLRFRRDLKPAAIAGVVGMTANSVAKALQRIRDQLRSCVERKAAMGEQHDSRTAATDRWLFG